MKTAELKSTPPPPRARTPVHDIAAEQWQQMHGQVRNWWRRFTDDDLEKAAGKAEAVIGLIQEKYGYSRERSEVEFKRQVYEFETRQKEVARAKP